MTPKFSSALGSVAAVIIALPLSVSADPEKSPFHREFDWKAPSHSNSSRSKVFRHRGGNSFTEQFPEEFRTIDGFGNNQANPEWGAAVVPFLRLTTVGYSDGLSAPAGDTRPSAREISNQVVAQDESIPNDRRATDWLWQWGQFLDHDIDETPLQVPTEYFPIEVPQGDPYFDPTNSGTAQIPLSRSAYEEVQGVRQQVNVLTAFIDASNVYGSEEARANGLRKLDGSGELRTSSSSYGPLLPYNYRADTEGHPDSAGEYFANGALPGQSAEDLFLAGDIRANEQVGLTSVHTLFVREHNYWAKAIKRKDPTLDGDEIYEMARCIVAAEMQRITYNEFLPVLLGHSAIRPYKGYDEDVNAGISNVFATAAYRVGHTMLSEELLRLRRSGGTISEGNISLAESFFSPEEVSEIGIEPYLRGLASQPAQQIDNKIVDPVRNFLFGPPGSGGFDLASLNIQRGRDHGLPGYNQLRADFGLPRLSGFSDYKAQDPSVVPILESLYGSPEDMDAWVGLLGERHVKGGLVGETLSAILADQFTRLRDGDRFWYQNYLSKPLQQIVNQQSLADIIRRNTEISGEIQDQVFLLKGGRNERDDRGERGRAEESRERGDKGRRGSEGGPGKGKKDRR